jgi:hypothetical protein
VTYSCGVVLPFSLSFLSRHNRYWKGDHIIAIPDEVVNEVGKLAGSMPAFGWLLCRRG